MTYEVLRLRLETALLTKNQKLLDNVGCGGKKETYKCFAASI